MSAAAQRLAELRLALVFFTRLPIPLDEARQSTLAQAGWAFPICGAVAGLVMWLGYAVGAALGLPPPVCALLAVAAGMLVTGALHEDGLADFADGIGGGRDRPRKLEIMHDSATGSYGVLALILVVAIKVSALAEIGALGAALPANGPREHYMRATLQRGGDGTLIATAFDNQDSSLLRLYAQAGALIVRPPHAGALERGGEAEAIVLREP